MVKPYLLTRVGAAIVDERYTAYPPLNHPPTVQVAPVLSHATSHGQSKLNAEAAAVPFNVPKFHFTIAHDRVFSAPSESQYSPCLQSKFLRIYEIVS